MTFTISVGKSLGISFIMSLLLVTIFEGVQNAPFRRRWKSFPPLERDPYSPPSEIYKYPAKNVHKGDSKRAVNVEVNVEPKKSSNLKDDLLQELENALNFSSNDFRVSPDCENCTNLKHENKAPKDEAKPKVAHTLNPAYPCEEWDDKTRTCWLDRNIGDTVTFVLDFKEGSNPTVQWKQEFHTLHSAKKNKSYVIDPDSPLWNIVIGSHGHELRLSPITEIDIDFNSFSATLLNDHATQQHVASHTANFRIRVRPIDHGFAYPGETLMLNMKGFNLPPTSMRFKWYLEKDGESSTLPSNMQLSPSGAVLVISELRKEQEGILACSVYTNLGFFATKQRFIIKEINQSNNLLMFVPTRPGTAHRRKRALDVEDNIEDMQPNPENKKPNLSLEVAEADESANNEEPSSNGMKNDVYAINKVDVRYKNLKEPTEEDTEMGEQPYIPIPQGHAMSFNGENFGPEQRLPMSGPNHHSKNVHENQNGAMEEETSPRRNGEPHLRRMDHSDEEMSQNGEQIIMEVDRKPNSAQSKARDHYSELIAACHSDLQCSSDATCIQRIPNRQGFCRCTSGFQGNGIFCWEEIKQEQRNSRTWELSKRNGSNHYTAWNTNNEKDEI